jgi:uncharacterized membrane protein YraQ (UPF0718 family)
MALARLLTAILTSFVIGITLFVIFDKKNRQRGKSFIQR